MKNEKLLLYTVVNCEMTNHLDEICQDIRAQYENNIATCALFSMALVPEGNPPEDKVGAYCRKYKLFKEKLDSMGIPNGVLIQASMGHGRKLASPSAFKKCEGIAVKDAGDVCCPYDENFREHMKGVMAHIASLKPDCFMVDDDTRLVARPGRGCACPLHMARFNELSGENLTREELWDAIHKNDEKGKKYRKIFMETQKESMLFYAKALREGVDSVDPTIPGTVSVVRNHEAGAEIAKILAGKENPSVLRLGNGNYTSPGARNLSKVSLRTARQINHYKDKVDYILAETDTCPQNRYSTGANSLHTHFTASIIEGTCGAKHWITRLRAFEPDSGKAYRKVLSKNYGFYSELAKIVPTLSWRGFRIPMPQNDDYDISRKEECWQILNQGWPVCVLERLGLPMYFSGENGGIACFEGDSDSEFSNEEILEMLKGNVFLASNTAKNLIDRGFGKYLGVDVKEWTNDKKPNGEIIRSNSNIINMQVQYKELIPTSEKTEIYSDTIQSLTIDRIEVLSPAVTGYKNELGGNVFVFCGTPLAEYHYLTAFSFLNESRKKQFIEIAKRVGELPIYCISDQEVHLRVADMPDGKTFLGVFNISLDPMDELEIVSEKKITKIEKLMPDGTKECVEFSVSNGKYTVNVPCNILDPVILFLS